jgi:RNA polymerase sigma factor (sigma-70 family)
MPTRGVDQALDELLVLHVRAGSRAALDRLAARWTPKLLAFASRTMGTTEAARDVVQDTWESALRGLDRLQDPARFRSWIYAIAARKCSDALRSRYRGQRLADSASAEVARNDAAVDAGAAVVSHLDLAVALKRLPPEQRTAVSLYFGEEMSVAEIAVATGAPEGTVKSRLFAARLALRAFMKGEVQ